jgi:serine/threonine-protein kinase
MPIVGDVLAERYRLDAPLGAGGMATVWRARDLRLDRDVAVKLLAANLAGDPVVAERFEREARSLAASTHPNVVAIYDVERGDRTAGREPFYVMELCDGGSLADRLAAAPGGRLSPSELIPMMSAIADGLSWLHRHGIVHRDVKPHNILLCGGRAKLADFGLARRDGTELAALTATGTAMGTIAYVAPEVLEGAPASPVADVYSLAAVVFQGLTGRLPRPGGSVAEVIVSRDVPAPRASEVEPRLGRAFDLPLADALARDPGMRPDARTFGLRLGDGLAPPSRDGRTGGIEDADAVTQEIPVPHTLGVERPRQPIARAGSRGRRTGGGAPIAAALLLLVLAALVVAALALALGNLGGLAVRSPSIAATPSASPAAPSPSSPAPSPSPPSPSPSPPPSTPPPTPTPDPVAEVAAARDDLEAVVDGLRDQGLRDRDADEIVRNADDVVAAVEAGDEDRARQRLGRIQDRVDRAANDLDADAAASLREAADRLEAAVNAAFA